MVLAGLRQREDAYVHVNYGARTGTELAGFRAIPRTGRASRTSSTANLPKIVQLRGRHFTRPCPAHAIMGVSSPSFADVEIDIKAVAVTDDAGDRV